MGFLTIAICAGLGITLPIIMFNQVRGACGALTPMPLL